MWLIKNSNEDYVVFKIDENEYGDRSTSDFGKALRFSSKEEAEKEANKWANELIVIDFYEELDKIHPVQIRSLLGDD